LNTFQVGFDFEKISILSKLSGMHLEKSLPKLSHMFCFMYEFLWLLLQVIIKSSCIWVVLGVFAFV